MEIGKQKINAAVFCKGLILKMNKITKERRGWNGVCMRPLLQDP